jgi:hypothetical protein
VQEFSRRSRAWLPLQISYRLLSARKAGLLVCFPSSVFTLKDFVLATVLAQRGFFFPILVFFLIEMNPAKSFFLNLALLSCANPYDVTYEGVAPI